MDGAANVSTSIEVDVFGTPAFVLAVTGAELVARRDAGLLVIGEVDFTDRALSMTRRASHGSADARSESRDHAAEQFLQMGGLVRPLVWNLRGQVLNSIEDIVHRTAFTDLASCVEHEAIAMLADDPQYREQIEKHRFLVYVFGPHEPHVEHRLHTSLSLRPLAGAERVGLLVDEFIEIAFSKGMIEREHSHVPTRGRQITSEAQISSALRQYVSVRADSPDALLPPAEFLAAGWSALKEIRVEINEQESAIRSRLRSGGSVATSSIGIHACVAVLVELFRRYGTWGEDAEAALRASCLARRNDPDTSLGSAARFWSDLDRVLEVPGDQELGSKAAVMLVESQLTTYLGHTLDMAWREAGLSDIRRDVTEGAGRFGADLERRWDSGQAFQLAMRDVDSSLAGAEDLVRAFCFTKADQGTSRRDFFDADAPWWWIGGIIGYDLKLDRRRTGEVRPRVLRGQSKSAEAKDWIGALAVRLLPDVHAA